MHGWMVAQLPAVDASLTLLGCVGCQNDMLKDTRREARLATAAAMVVVVTPLLPPTAAVTSPLPQGLLPDVSRTPAGAVARGDAAIGAATAASPSTPLVSRDQAAPSRRVRVRGNRAMPSPCVRPETVTRHGKVLSPWIQAWFHTHKAQLDRLAPPSSAIVRGPFANRMRNPSEGFITAFGMLINGVSVHTGNMIKECGKELDLLDPKTYYACMRRLQPAWTYLCNQMMIDNAKRYMATKPDRVRLRLDGSYQSMRNSPSCTLTVTVRMPGSTFDPAGRDEVVCAVHGFRLTADTMRKLQAGELDARGGKKAPIDDPDNRRFVYASSSKNLEALLVRSACQVRTGAPAATPPCSPISVHCCSGSESSRPSSTLMLWCTTR